MLCNKKIQGAGAAEEDDEGAEKREVDTDTILAAGIMRGLTRADAESMTMGMWVDYVIEWNAMNRPETETEKQEGPKRATQADFDNF